MKKLLILGALILSGCASAPKPPVDQGVSCAKMTKDANKETCILSDTYIDSTRWHYLRPWEEDSFGDMPDLD